MKKSVLLIVFAFIYSKTNAQWVQQTSGSANFLTSVFFPTPTTGYITDGNGYILKTTNGGTNWGIVGSVSNVYSSLYFTSIDTGYATGTRGILKTTNGGLTWIDNFADSVFGISSVHFPTAATGYGLFVNVGMDSILIYKTIDAGNSWNKTTSFPSLGMPASIFFTNTSTGFIVLNGEGIYKTIDGGVTWVQKLTAIDLNSIHFPSDSIGYAVGLSGIYKTIDNGDTWSIQTNTNPTLFYSVHFTSIDTGYAVGGDGFSIGIIVKTVDGGINWTLSLTNPYTFGCVHFPNPSTGYVCGQGGTVYKLSTITGIEEKNESNNISVFPNPNNGKFIMNAENFANLNGVNISIYNIIGNIVFEKKLINNLENYTIDLSNEAKGVYYIKVGNKLGTTIEKMVIQ